ncbi:hypothetical protein QA612_15320 [Evansella sp. AB-P1]|uniref:hypothetical protein n=1 Tax=Evansella sp. AB-P1 TaxID=3037653 RepID=UPI00241F769D|nr:hypothetical protein [Evansella sp. AB-P1]MDG5788841.1 hypothetical protein [Evansella sp. AB-P1]
MSQITEKTNVDIYGPNGQNVEILIRRLSQIQWYENIGDKMVNIDLEDTIKRFTDFFQVEGVEVVALSKEQLPDFFEGMKLSSSPLWGNLNQIPQDIKKELVQSEREDLMVYINDMIPELVFHGAYDGAFRQLEQLGRNPISICTGAAMTIAGLAVAWEMIGDQEGWEVNPFVLLVDVLEKGHLPLGLYEGRFYCA